MTVNLSANHFDTRIPLNMCLESGYDISVCLGLCGKVNGNVLLESFYSNYAMKNICASKSYHQVYLFATYTCNKKTVWKMWIIGLILVDERNFILGYTS